MHTPQLAQILKNSEYKLELFSQEAIKNLEANIIVKNANGGGGNKHTSYSPCPVSENAHMVGGINLLTTRPA